MHRVVVIGKKVAIVCTSTLSNCYFVNDIHPKQRVFTNKMLFDSLVFYVYKTAYGTPQQPNQESCPCNTTKCREEDDMNAYCNATSNTCICSDNFMLNAGVCVPIWPPEYCYMFEENCQINQVRLAWTQTPLSTVTSYRIYKNEVEFITIASIIGEIIVSVNGDLSEEYLTTGKILDETCITGRDDKICISVETQAQYCYGQQTTNYSITAMYGSAPLIESQEIICESTSPTEAPTITPTRRPTLPTRHPSQPGDTRYPTTDPTISPSPCSTDNTTSPTTDPSSMPTEDPTEITGNPTISPTTSVPTEITLNPTENPTVITLNPTTIPTTANPTEITTVNPTEITANPTKNPVNVEEINGCEMTSIVLSVIVLIFCVMSF